MDSQSLKKKTFKRLLSYIKPYKLTFAIAILGMVGFSAVDSAGISGAGGAL